MHDLQFRLADEAEPSTVLAPEIIDATAPVGSFAAGSEVVALARQTSDTHDVGLWIADDNERERSFAALMAAAAASEEGSGWLEWEPYEVRTRSVMSRFCF